MSQIEREREGWGREKGTEIHTSFQKGKMYFFSIEIKAKECKMLRLLEVIVKNMGWCF